MYRKKMSRRGSKKFFKKGNKRTQKVNQAPPIMRGGIRL